MKLTDEQLDSLEHSHGMIESEYTPTCRSVPYGNGCPGATDDSQDFWRCAADAVPAMIAELRSHRAAELTGEEVESLRVLRDGLHQHFSWCSSDGTTHPCDCGAPMGLAVLDKLIAKGGAG